MSQLLNGDRHKYRNSLVGECSKTVQIVRDTNSKYYVSRDNMPGFYYPQFCFGTTYVASNTAIEQLLRVAATTPLTPLEDTSMGILAKKSESVKMFSIPNWRTQEINICPITYTVFELSYTNIEKIWNECSQRWLGLILKIYHHQNCISWANTFIHEIN